MLLGSSCTIISLSHSVPAVSRLRVGKNLGMDTIWTADGNWPKEYSTPYGITLNNKNLGEVLFVRSTNYSLLRDWMGFGLFVGGGNRLALHHLFYFFLLSFLFPLLIKVSLSQTVSLPTFVPPILFLTLLRIRSEQAAVCCLAAGQGQWTTIYFGRFLIVFTSKKPVLTILVPPHPVHWSVLSILSFLALSSFLSLVYAEIW